MAESKTQGRRSGAAKPGKGSAKAGKEAPKAPKAPAKTAKPPAKAAKAPAKTEKAPAKTAKVTAKTAKGPAKTARATATGAKGTARPAKAPAKPRRKVTARTASDAAEATATPPAVAPAAAKPAAPRPPAKRKVVQDTARSYFDAVGARDAATMAAHWHREGIYDSVPLGVFRGPDAVRRLYQEMFAAMPDMRTTVERITADDRVAAVQWRASGTFSGGPFQGIEPTGRQIELRGIDSLEVEDGKILRDTSVYDGAAVARGMGLLPAEDSGADRALRVGFNTVTKLRRVVAARTGGGQ